MDAEILVADYHRNGVSGMGFYLAIVNTDEGQFLCIDFSGEKDSDDYDRSRFAVLKMDDVRRGNIGMYPITHPDTGGEIEGQGGAAYRGDHFSYLSDSIKSWVQRSFDKQMEEWKAKRPNRTPKSII